MTAPQIPLGGSVEHRLYSKAELTTLLERMARLVVQEASNVDFLSLAARIRIRRLVDSPEKLQQLREAVERP